MSANNFFEETSQISFRIGYDTYVTTDTSLLPEDVQHAVLVIHEKNVDQKVLIYEDEAINFLEAVVVSIKHLNDSGRLQKAREFDTSFSFENAMQMVYNFLKEIDSEPEED